MSGVVLLAAATATQVSEDHAAGRALVSTLTQLPEPCAAGCRVTRCSAPVAVPGVGGHRVEFFARFYGGLRQMPKWAQGFYVLGACGRPMGNDPLATLIVQLGGHRACCAGGLIAYRRARYSRVSGT